MHAERRVGPYRLLSQLGRGAYGEVWLARRDDLPEPVALKLPRARGGEHLARFAAEVEIARKLNHSGIVRALDAGQDGSQLYCALVYHPGPTLAERLRTGPFTPNEACAMVHAMALAMQHAHEHGVVHRDLKPANVILDARTGEPWITDFGLARDDDTLRLTQTQQSIGTPHYMAPEQIHDAKHADARADVYALGTMLFHMISGRTPYEGDVAADVLTQKLMQDPPRLDRLCPEVPAGLAGVVARALAREPDDRFPTARALALAIHVEAPDTRILRLDPEALGDLEPEPPAESAGSRRLVIGLGLVALALLSALIGLLVAKRARTPAPAAAAVTPLPTSSAQPIPVVGTPAATPTAEPGSDAQSGSDGESKRESAPWLKEAAALLAEGQSVEAEALLSQAIERGRGAQILLDQDPDAVDLDQLNAYRFRATARYELRDFEGALGDHTQAIELCPRMAQLYEERGKTYWLQERLEEALGDFDKALELEPESAIALLYRAYCRREAGDAEGAEADLGALIALQPELGTVYFERARLRHTRGAHEQALADYDRLLELEPDSAEGLAWRGQLYIDTQRYEPAVADLTRALEVWPGNTEGREGVEASLKNLRAYLSQR